MDVGKEGRWVAVPPASSKATGCHWLGSWEQWGTQASCSLRSCYTEPPLMVGFATHLCSTLSVPSGSFHQPHGRSCVPAGWEDSGQKTERSAVLCMWQGLTIAEEGFPIPPCKCPHGLTVTTEQWSRSTLQWSREKKPVACSWQ